MREREREVDLQISSSVFDALLTLFSNSMATGTIISITVPAFYSKFEEPVDRYCGMIHRQFSKHYKIVDDGVFSRLPRSFSKNKDS